MSLTQAFLFAFIAYLTYKLLANFNSVDMKKIKKDILSTVINANIQKSKTYKSDFENHLVALRSGNPVMVEEAIQKYEATLQQDLKELEDFRQKIEDPNFDLDSLNSKTN